MKRLMVLILCFSGFLAATYLFAEVERSDGDRLWRYIYHDSPYSAWDFWGDHKGIQQGVTPHGNRHRVYVNKAGLNSQQVPVNYNTVIVKENLNSNDMVLSLTVMSKVKGYNREGGDWFWAKYSPKGKVLRSGKIQGCLGCHISQKNNDFIFTHSFNR